MCSLMKAIMSTLKAKINKTISWSNPIMQISKELAGLDLANGLILSIPMLENIGLVYIPMRITSILRLISQHGMTWMSLLCSRASKKQWARTMSTRSRRNWENIMFHIHLCTIYMVIPKSKQVSKVSSIEILKINKRDHWFSQDPGGLARRNTQLFGQQILKQNGIISILLLLCCCPSAVLGCHFVELMSVGLKGIQVKSSMWDGIKLVHSSHSLELTVQLSATEENHGCLAQRLAKTLGNR